MKRVLDYAPDVLEVLGESTMTQTELTEAVWGTSGRNSPKLVNLLAWMVSRGMLKLVTKGRAKYFTKPNT